ncbi:MAG: hypothetical protein L0Y71_07100 [Gemmataceae bacterium]|nr:hypothetical protein [Gemmataceae bacterium]
MTYVAAAEASTRHEALRLFRLSPLPFALPFFTAWQAGDDPGSYCPAMPITWRGRRLVVAYLRNALVLHDLKTGRVVGRQGLSADYDEHSAWPSWPGTRCCRTTTCAGRRRPCGAAGCSCGIIIVPSASIWARRRR